MPILTPTEAMQILNYIDISEMPKKVTSIFLPAIDAAIYQSTGFDWSTLTATYTVIDPLAKMAAGILLCRWFEDSSQTGKTSYDAYVGIVSQLETKYLQSVQTTEKPWPPQYDPPQI